MYKAYRAGKYSISFGTFGKRAKEVSKVYTPGFHKWETDDSTNYSIVIGTSRVIFSINKPEIGTCPE